MESLPHVQLYLRNAVPAGTRSEQQAVVGRLERLEADGLIAGFTVSHWPGRVTTTSDTTDEALTAYEGFTKWAATADASMHPAFDQHACHSLYTGTEFTTTVFPVMCLAVSDDAGLRAVYPNVRRGTPQTVMDGLEMLEGDNQPLVA